MPKTERMWAYLIHLSYNMWADWKNPETKSPYNAAQPYLRCDESLWDDLMPRMRDAGINTVLVDVGDGVQFKSHPEIAVMRAWSWEKLQGKLEKIRALGMEPLPKLNFSTCHDQWMGIYSRMVSTPQYYQVCKDVIAEVLANWGKAPSHFHLGMDEELAIHQRSFEYVVVRQYGLWWRDFSFYCDQLPKNVRPWIWSDYIWDKLDDFVHNMPTTVLQSNWYYGAKFGPEIKEPKGYIDLEQHGYDQVPTFSTWTTDVNAENTVRFIKEHVGQERIKGFVETVWRPTLEETRDRHIAAIDQTGRARKLFESL